MQCVNHPEVDQDVVRCLRCQQPFCPDCVVMLRGYWYCGPCKVEQVRDIQSGASSALEMASMGRRVVAVLVDSLVLGAAMMVFFLPFIFMVGGMAALGEQGRGGAGRDATEAALGFGIIAFYLFALFMSFALPLAYEGWMLQRRGQTLGKMALSIRVVGAEGGPLSRGQAWGRSALKVALSQACSCAGLLADDLPAFFTAEKTALHDLAARTRVVRVY